MVRAAQAVALQLTKESVASHLLPFSIRFCISDSAAHFLLFANKKKIFFYFCSSIETECKEYFSKSLFLVGEIGANDYNYAFFKGKTLDDAKTYVPTVAGAVTDATEVTESGRMLLHCLFRSPLNNCNSQQRLIKAGATHLVVPGNLPMGCSSAYLTLHPGRNSSAYDSAGCLKTYNDFAQHHNAVLQQKLQALRAKYPQARIMYADYYGAAMSFAKNPKQFGEFSS